MMETLITPTIYIIGFIICVITIRLFYLRDKDLFVNNNNTNSPNQFIYEFDNDGYMVGGNGMVNIVPLFWFVLIPLIVIGFSIYYGFRGIELFYNQWIKTETH